MFHTPDKANRSMLLNEESNNRRKTRKTSTAMNMPLQCINRQTHNLYVSKEGMNFILKNNDNRTMTSLNFKNNKASADSPFCGIFKKSDGNIICKNGEVSTNDLNYDINAGRLSNIDRQSKSSLVFANAFCQGNKLLSEEYFRGLNQQKVIDNLGKSKNLKSESIDLHFELKHFLETELSSDAQPQEENDEVKYIDNSPEQKKHRRRILKVNIQKIKNDFKEIYKVIPRRRDSCKENNNNFNNQNKRDEEEYKELRRLIQEGLDMEEKLKETTNFDDHNKK